MIMWTHILGGLHTRLFTSFNNGLMYGAILREWVLRAFMVTLLCKNIEIVIGKLNISIGIVRLLAADARQVVNV